MNVRQTWIRGGDIIFIALITTRLIFWKQILQSLKPCHNKNMIPAFKTVCYLSMWIKSRVSCAFCGKAKQAHSWYGNYLFMRSALRWRFSFFSSNNSMPRWKSNNNIQQCLQKPCAAGIMYILWLNSIRAVEQWSLVLSCVVRNVDFHI